MSVGTPMLDMSYFYSAYSFFRGKGDYRNTRLLFYRGVDQEMERELDGRGVPMTEERECLYSVLCSESIHPENREIEALYQKGQEMGMELEDFFFLQFHEQFFCEERELSLSGDLYSR